MATSRQKSRQIEEFGDFQTPFPLALAATRVIRDLGFRPRAIIEPTCGEGAFVRAASVCFPGAETIVGIEINPRHLAVAAALREGAEGRRIVLRQGDFFAVEWGSVVARDAGPWLILGNPPWVTSAALGALASDNLPKKMNIHQHRGIEALTGKSNFDISEWMLLRYLDWLRGTVGMIAVICKVSVARKVLRQIWHQQYPVRDARIYAIDASQHFGAAVGACFFVLETGLSSANPRCEIYPDLDAPAPTSALGFHRGHLLADVTAFERWGALYGSDSYYSWRSGIKHDCAKVMELRHEDGGYRNGLGETVAVEDSLVYPLLKSSDIGNGRTTPRVSMLVPQQTIGQETATLRSTAPAAWEYLCRHAELLNGRGSSIYRNRPVFSIFGVGSYSFTPWKIAVSSLYKRLRFSKVGPVAGKPMVFDDTINFLPCRSEAEADFLYALLSSVPATEFLNAMIQWDEKRPITIDLLKRLHLGHLASLLGREAEYRYITSSAQPQSYTLPLPLT